MKSKNLKDRERKKEKDKVNSKITLQYPKINESTEVVGIKFHHFKPEK